MIGTANRPQVTTAWEPIDADEVGVLQARAIRQAGLMLNPSSDQERLPLSVLFDLPTTSNLPELFAQPTALRFGLSRVVLDIANLLGTAILEEDQHLGEAATDQYLYEDQSPIEVPDNWFAELRQTKVLADEDFELPWADG